MGGFGGGGGMPGGFDMDDLGKDLLKTFPLKRGQAVLCRQREREKHAGELCCLDSI
jgi:hypothetical protein